MDTAKRFAVTPLFKVVQLIPFADERISPEPPTAVTVLVSIEFWANAFTGASGSSASLVSAT
jgi:hypothetical protein